jgi:predicted 3-demethylubiquinone-9 3-methyltransferase (glyoxalase superfamily)
MANTIAPCLWFDDNAEDALNFYVSVFPNARVGSVGRYPEGGPGPAGSVMVARCELEGQEFILLNGGPLFKFTEAVSFTIHCDDQTEVDDYWEKLLAGGGSPSRCGWLKDKFGVSWQVIPRALDELMGDTDPAKRERVFTAMLGMIKLDIGALKRAHAG